MATPPVAQDIFDRLFTDDASRFELVDGELKSKPMVSIFYSLMISWLSHLLHREVEAQAGSDLWVLTDPLAKIREDQWRRPDIAVITAENAEPWKYVMPGHWPALCIEIVSPPDQTVEEMLKKAKLYHEQGVPHCWVIEPESRAGWMFDLGKEPVSIPNKGGALNASSIGIRLTLDEIWRGLRNKRGKRLLP